VDDAHETTSRARFAYGRNPAGRRSQPGTGKREEVRGLVFRLAAAREDPLVPHGN
jgi:hypothetical protein